MQYYYKVETIVKLVLSVNYGLNTTILFLKAWINQFEKNIAQTYREGMHMQLYSRFFYELIRDKEI